MRPAELISTSGNASSVAGLSRTEVARLHAQYGPNELARDRATPLWRALVRQLASPLIALMLGAAAVALVLGERLDATAIAAIVVLNAVLGVVQEARAERAILGLRSLTAPRARVIRDGAQHQIAARDVVPGDVLVLEAGDIVAADATLFEAATLATNEAPLTGESVPVAKSCRPGHYHVFMGTTVVTGTGRAHVTAIGMATELGRVAHLLASAQPPETPLQRRLAEVGRWLLWASLAIVFVVGASELVRGGKLIDVVLSAVSLAVAAVPEGLPAIVSIALAVGVRRMSARHALVRKLPAIETLGATTVICSDKTGTLTTGVMAVREVWGADPQLVLETAVACCDADLASGLGDVTELAILAEGVRRGIDRAAIEHAHARVEVWPFDPATRRMAILRSDGVIYAKGAVEVLARADDHELRNTATRLASAGKRVLAVARGPAHDALVPIGLIAIADPPRPDVPASIALAHAAGIRTIMITGDHQLTATAIARELALARPGESIEDVVRARTTPEQKLEIVRDLASRGEVVAMTGDGANDAPALREAHVGIAMGKSGTDVTREVAQIVLADDNFSTIVAAVREGRSIFDNIRKALVYLLAGNAAELAVMLIASLAGLPLPFVPLQLLWINLVTDGLPALALVMDPPASDVMARPPRPPREPILGRREWWTIAASALLEGGVTLASYAWMLHHRGIAEARTVAFTVLVASELFRAFAFRSRGRILWQVGAFGNLVLVAVVAGSIAAQLVLLYVAPIRALFACAPLTVIEVTCAMLLGLIPVTVLEIAKLVRGGTRLAEPAT